MGNSKSSEIVVADNMSEDKSESFNVVNTHSPTAGLGLSLAFDILCMSVGFEVYRRFCMALCGPRKEGRKEPQAPTPAISLDMPDLHVPGAGEGLKCITLNTRLFHHTWMTSTHPRHCLPG